MKNNNYNDDQKKLSFDFDPPAADEQKTERKKTQFTWHNEPITPSHMITPEELMGKTHNNSAAPQNIPMKHVDMPSAANSEQKEAAESADSASYSSAAQQLLNKMRSETDQSNVHAAQQDEENIEPEDIFTPPAPAVEDDSIKAAVAAILAAQGDDDETTEPEFRFDQPVDEPKPEAQVEKDELDFTVDEPTTVIDINNADAAEDGDDIKNYVPQNAQRNPARDSIIESFEIEKQFDTPDPAADDMSATAVFTPPVIERDEFDINSMGENFEDGYEDGDDGEIEQIDDYNTVDDALTIRSAFLSRCRKLRVRALVTAIVTVLLFAFAIVKDLLPFGKPVYFIVSAALIAAAMLVNLTTTLSIFTIFKGKPDSDCTVALAMLFSLIQTVSCLFHNISSATAASMIGAAACCSLYFNCKGKISQIKRILKNLDMISNEEDKDAVTFIEPPTSGKLVDINLLGETLICARRRTIDLKGFLKNSLSPDPYEKTSGRTTLIASVIAFAFALLTLGINFFLTKHGVNRPLVVPFFTTLAAVYTLFSPFSALAVSGFAMSRICNRLRLVRATLSGFSAAEMISDSNVIELDASELFGDEDISLYNFRSFNGYPIDRAILNAAALTLAGKSPLANLFNKIVASNRGHIPVIDSVEYEEKMGLTGWNEDSKFLIGNRMIMEAHNIPDIPPIGFDRKVLTSGKFPVYFAVDGRLAALFIVGYDAVNDESVYRIRKLANTGVTLLVRSTDPNVTARLITDCYGINPESVLVMSADQNRLYQSVTASTQSEQALLSCKNSAGFIDGYVASINLRQSATIASVLLTIVSIVFSVLVAVLLIINAYSFVNIFTITAVHLLSFIACLVVSIIKQ